MVKVLQSKKIIGIIMGKIYKDTNRKLIQGILKQAFNMNYDAYVFTLTEENTELKITMGEENLFHLINFSLLDGIIFAPYTFSSFEYSDYISSFLKENCPKPIIRIGIEETEFIKMWYDDREDFRKITSHLINEHGCKEIICLTGPYNLKVSHSRLSGFYDAMHTAGLNIDEKSVIFGDFWLLEAKKLAREIAEGNRKKTDAVVCANDLMAISFCDAIIEYGFSVPEDIRITGYDGTIDAGSHFPQITTYFPPMKQLGRNAVLRLHSEITGTKFENIQEESGILKSSHSCGCSNNLWIDKTLYFNYQKLEDLYVDNYLSTRFLSAGNLYKFLYDVYELSNLFIDVPQNCQIKYTVCLCEDWDKPEFNNFVQSYYTVGYSEKMMLMNEQGEFTYFNTSDMLPQTHKNFEKPSVTFFTSVHFQERCYGYALLSYENHADAFSPHYMRFCREVNNGLEFLHIQNELKSLAYQNYLATTRDNLTGFYKMEMFSQLWKDVSKQATFCQNNIFIICISLNGVYQIKESYGSMNHDEFLINFADIINGCCRYKEKCLRLDEYKFVIIGMENKEQNRHNVIQKELDSRLADYNQNSKYKIRITAQYSYEMSDVENLCSHNIIKNLISLCFEELDKKQLAYSEQIYYNKLICLRKMIYENPGYKWNMKECSHQMNICLSYFQRLYFETFGINYGQDVKKCKISYAKKLLLNTNDTLQVIAEKCGYTYAHFMRTFKKEENMTPTQFRTGKTNINLS